MIQSKDLMGITRPAIKPGRLPEPPEPVSTRDPPEVMAVCLSCPLPGCHVWGRACPLYGYTQESKKKERQRRAGL